MSLFSTTALIWTAPELQPQLAEAQRLLQDYLEHSNNIRDVENARDLLRVAQSVLLVADVASAHHLCGELNLALTQWLTNPQPNPILFDKMLYALLHVQYLVDALTAGNEDSPALTTPLIDEFRVLRHAPIMSDDPALSSAEKYLPHKTAPHEEHHLLKWSLRGRNKAALESAAHAFQEELSILQEHASSPPSIVQKTGHFGSPSEDGSNDTAFVDARTHLQHLATTAIALQWSVVAQYLHECAECWDTQNTNFDMRLKKDIATLRVLVDQACARDTTLRARPFQDPMQADTYKEIMEHLAHAKYATAIYAETNDTTQWQDAVQLLKAAHVLLQSLPPNDVWVYTEKLHAWGQENGTGIQQPEMLFAWCDALGALEYALEAQHTLMPNVSVVLAQARLAVRTLDPYWEPVFSAPENQPSMAQKTPQEMVEHIPKDAGVAVWDPSQNEAAQPPDHISDAHPHFPNPALLPNNQEELEPIAEHAQQYPVVLPPVVLPGMRLLIPFDAPASIAIDQDIHAVFAEELHEEIISLDEWLLHFRPGPVDPDLLYNIRKSFHAVKGSGRMVGAATLGEMAWKVESVLNMVLDEALPLTSNIICLVHTARDTFATFKNALDGNEVYWAPELLMEWADQLCEGQDASSPYLAPPQSDQHAAPLLCDPSFFCMPDTDVPELMEQKNAAASSKHGQTPMVHGLLDVPQTSADVSIDHSVSQSAMSDTSLQDAPEFILPPNPTPENTYEEELDLFTVKHFSEKNEENILPPQEDFPAPTPPAPSTWALQDDHDVLPTLAPTPPLPTAPAPNWGLEPLAGEQPKEETQTQETQDQKQYLHSSLAQPVVAEKETRVGAPVPVTDVMSTEPPLQKPQPQKHQSPSISKDEASTKNDWPFPPLPAYNTENTEWKIHLHQAQDMNDLLRAMITQWAEHTSDTAQKNVLLQFSEGVLLRQKNAHTRIQELVTLTEQRTYRPSPPAPPPVSVRHNPPPIVPSKPWWKKFLARFISKSADAEQ